jgi:hypothetical protein
MRSACKGLPFFKKHEDKSYCVLHYPSKEKNAAFLESFEMKLQAEDFNFDGVWFPDYISFAGLTFTKAAKFRFAVFNSGATFSHTTFNSEAYFSHVTFRAETLFSYAVFSAEANFNCATFSAGADFRSALFSAGAIFTSAKFGAGAFFNSATFSAIANFGSATFSAVAIFDATFNADAFFSHATFSAVANFNATFNADADFRSASFSAGAIFNSTTFRASADFHSSTFSAEANFKSATFNSNSVFTAAIFKDYVRFAGVVGKKTFCDNSLFNLQFTRIEKPDRLSFHTLRLRPHWFVNVDSRRFEFINVDWNWRGISIKQEIKSIDEKDVLSAHRLLAIACRNLAVNAEENHRYEEASKFRYMAMDARRLENLFGFTPWTLRWWYWLASGYGERVWRAFVVLIGVWLVAAALYTQVGFARWEPRVSTQQEAAEARRDEVGEPLRLPRALTYSLGVMTLQKPEPRPATNAAQSLVMLETILGPVQAALLALAIRRKFMR